jgi:hypothetical protein
MSTMSMSRKLHCTRVIGVERCQVVGAQRCTLDEDGNTVEALRRRAAMPKSMGVETIRDEVCTEFARPENT